GGKRGHDIRSPRDDVAPARTRSRATELLPQRHRAPSDGRAWRSVERGPRLKRFSRPPGRRLFDNWQCPRRHFSELASCSSWVLCPQNDAEKVPRLADTG